jgi:hypothetical protein
MSHTRYALAMLLWGTLLAGCAAQDESEPAQDNNTMGQRPQCSADADCVAGQSCEQGVCAVQPEQARALSFVFLPPSTSGYLPQRLDGLELFPGDPLNFLLEPSVQVDGDVSVLDRVSGNAQVLTSGTLLFTRRGDGDDQLTRQVRLTEPSFETKLRPGTYTITYLPPDEGRLGWRWLDQEIKTHATLALTMPEQSKATIEVAGKLTHRDGLLGDALSSVGVAGVRVSAIQRQTGQSSTVAITNEVGEFRLLVWPDSGDYDLRIGPAEPDTLAPRAVLSSAFVAGREPITLDAELGAYPSSARTLGLKLQIARQTLDALDVEPGELTITARAQLARGELVVTRRLGADGTLALELLPMRTTLTITPPLTSRFGPLTLELDLTVAALELAAAELPLRRRVTGTLLTASGQPAKRAKLIVYTASEQGEVTRKLEVEPSATFLTDDDGAFEVWVDRGQATRWELVPESGQNVPRGTFTLAGGDEDQTAVQIALPAPTALSGSVRGEEFEAQPDVAIQVIETIDKITRVIAEGTTDRQGKFRLYVAF